MVLLKYNMLIFKLEMLIIGLEVCFSRICDVCSGPCTFLPLILPTHNTNFPIVHLNFYSSNIMLIPSSFL